MKWRLKNKKAENVCTSPVNFFTIEHIYFHPVYSNEL